MLYSKVIFLMLLMGVQRNERAPIRRGWGEVEAGDIGEFEERLLIKYSILEIVSQTRWNIVVVHHMQDGEKSDGCCCTQCHRP